ncbi:MAG: type II toxin-antitoxin system HicA family toxin [Nostoc sp.]|uniref:type II toxin-antitoxin system HicA family toxin n=1 Tax=Nostoc sp. TaxID=1180 RepID=UPI002FFA8C14
MKSISGKQLCKIVEQKGWVLQRTTGNHHIYDGIFGFVSGIPIRLVQPQRL